jgi:UDP-N-acetylmuramate dehydrogenase
LRTARVVSCSDPCYNGFVKHGVTLEEVRARLPGVSANVPLSAYTTFKIGGPAEFFLKAESEDDVATAVRASRELGLPLTVLGGGSNVVIADSGIPGLVILVSILGVERRGELLRVGAGENFQRLTTWTSREGLSGLEFGIGIYGTIGGAVAGNAGAFGSSMGTVVESVEVIDATGERRTYPNAECGFVYRRSRFPAEGAIVLSADLRTTPSDPKRITATVTEFLSKKRAKQPLGSRCAGCIFKNVQAVLPRDAGLLERFADIARGTEIPVGAIIHEVGLGGARAGGVEISNLHGNFFVNTGAGTAEQVVILMSRVQQRVRDTFGVQLQPEVRLIGFEP